MKLWCLRSNWYCGTFIVPLYLYEINSRTCLHIVQGTILNVCLLVLKWSFKLVSIWRVNIQAVRSCMIMDPVFQNSSDRTGWSYSELSGRWSYSNSSKNWKREKLFNMCIGFFFASTVDKIQAVGTLIDAFCGARTNQNTGATRCAQITSLDFDHVGQVAAGSVQVGPRMGGGGGWP